MRARADILRFAAVWIASLLSGVGSSLTGFVLGVWVYQVTGSPTQFALVMLCGLLPGILIGPFAGIVVDRFDRRRVLIVTDCLAALPTLAIVFLIQGDRLAVWHLYLASAITAACGTFHATTYQAMTPLLIPKRHLGRANGLMQITWATQIAAPVLAGTLLVAVGTTGVLVVDLATFAVAVLTLLLVRLPAAVLRPAGTAGAPDLRTDLVVGWRYLRRRPQLLGLVFVQTGFNFVFATAGVLVQPLILSFATADVLGVLMLAGGAGMFCGSLLMGVWGGPKGRVRGMAVLMAAGGVALFLHTLRPSPLLVGVAAAAFLFTLPVVGGCAQAVMQTKIEREVLGRVLGTAHSLGTAATPVAYLLAAPVAEFVTGPLLMPGGGLAGSFGPLIGVGEGRGIAFVLLLDAVLLAALAAITAFTPGLRRLETTLPDAVPDDAPAPVPAP
ncbi:MFS transporter [Nonomuraea sp. bgisy101]|uniref:MFS transporter n=1 Tax=Nonomuraea sp. bgisy101 TaxID=3413784 RepID=UPI003D71213C